MLGILYFIGIIVSAVAGTVVGFLDARDTLQSEGTMIIRLSKSVALIPLGLITGTVLGLFWPISIVIIYYIYKNK